MCVSIPLEQGNVFRLNLPLTLTADRLVSIPLEQGNVFRLKENVQVFNGSSVSIPLEQGNVFRHTTLRNKVVDLGLNPFGTGQCLSTQGMDDVIAPIISLNPFGTGQCLSTYL